MSNLREIYFSTEFSPPPMYRPTFSDKKKCQIHYAQMRGKGDMGSR
jgi:hypothetical protein